MPAPQLTSVVAVTSHTGPALMQMIESVLAQTADVELILVNNGNPPEVEAALIERFRDDPAVRLMTGHGDVGFSRGANLGARVARGDHLLFLSPSARLASETLAALYRDIADIKGGYVLGARVLDESGGEVPLQRRARLTPRVALVHALGLSASFPAYRYDLSGTPFPRAVSSVPALGPAFLFTSRDVFAHHHGFNEQMLALEAVMDFCAHVRMEGGPVLVSPRVSAVLGPDMAPPPPPRARAQSLSRYFHEHFAHEWPMPVLWLAQAAMVAKEEAGGRRK